MPESLTTEQLERAVVTISKIVKQHGRQYQPYYLDLKVALEQQKENDEIYQEILELANQ